MAEKSEAVSIPAVLVVGFMLFIFFMMYKEEKELPDDYFEQVKESSEVMKYKLAPLLQKILGEPDNKAKGCRGKYRHCNIMTYPISSRNSITAPELQSIETLGWIGYQKDYQPVDEFYFCQNKYELKIGGINQGHYFVSLEFGKFSPCWDFKATLQEENHHLVTHSQRQ
jgi:hypothetical protein